MEIPQEAIAKYLTRRLTDIENCRQALANGNLTVLETVGHQLKGNGLTFGFPEIATIGETLEAAAKKNDTTMAASCIESLEKVVSASTAKTALH